jgi:hypothetical protein
MEDNLKEEMKVREKEESKLQERTKGIGDILVMERKNREALEMEMRWKLK